ncbi:phage portal protein [Rhodobacter sp. KR11]|uniref:phage portal protein n=1 Tax=Rhodobacter sp. KR11 TaxID=2974588 RepID=UPI002222CECF|nr:phage portal protein [Rhodobacter sp. KR11]MCW1920824.1 phage portal protein [Rhodobacter sp. KR11]
MDRRTSSAAPEVPWGFFDRALAAVSPASAAKRYAARVAIANLRRGYEGGKAGRLTGNWSSANASADAEIAAASAPLRARSRDLVRNNALAAQAVQVLVNNIIGPGIRPRAASGNRTLNRKVDKLWTAFARSCDFYGLTDFYGLQNLAVREMVESGDILGLKIVAPGAAVPLKIQLREIDHLDDGRAIYSPVGGYTDQGIEYDAAGRRIGYWMFPNHPGSNRMMFTNGFRSERIGTDRVLHMFERQRVQNRGVPWAAPAVVALRDLGDWQQAELVRKKTEACLVGIVFGDDETQNSVAPVVQDSQGNQVEQFEPGLIAYARGGKDIKFNQPASTAGIYEWNRVQMGMIAAGFRVPYALMTGDLSQNNFSSSRVGLNEFRRMVEQLQWQTVIPMFCEPVWAWFVEACQLAGLIPVDAVVPAEWAPPRFEMVNPLQDVQADLLETRAGFASPQQMIAKRGYDPRAVVEEWAAHAAETDALGLVFDSDPRKVSKGGNVQPTDPGQSPPQPQQE